MHREAEITLSPPGRWKMLNLTWVAFFLTFVVWYNLGAFSTTIARVMHLTKEQAQVLLLCNLALTIPARIIIGGLLDRIGPRKTYSALLIYAIVPCTLFATAQSQNAIRLCRPPNERVWLSKLLFHSRTAATNSAAIECAGRAASAL